MNTRVIAIKGVGPVLFEHSKRAKNICIAVRPVNGVRVAVPLKVSFSQAEQLVYRKIGWIKNQRDKMRLLKEKHKRLVNGNPYMDWEKAKINLIERVAELAEHYNFTYGKVTVRNQKTRWGSCSPANNISLNGKLTLLPAELMDFVILHELVHTRIKNHGKVFWSQLKAVCPMAEEFDRRMKMYRISLL